MTARATGAFETKRWDEQAFGEVEGGPKLACAHALDTFTGDIEGEGATEYLLAYREDGVCSFSGLQRVVGSLGGRSGSFVLQHTGAFEGGALRATLVVLPACATGELRGLQGAGSYTWDGQEGHLATFTLDYDLAE